MINLSIRNYSITIGGLNCTTALISFQGHDANLDQSGLISFTGSIVLGRPIGFETLDDRKNNRWARGQQITLLIANKAGTLLPPPRGGKLYILDSQFDFKTKKLTLNVGDLFALLNIKEGKGDASKVCLGTATSRVGVINNLLAAAGLTATLDTIPGALLSAAPRLIEGSYIEQAGAIAASAGYFLWIDSTGLVRANAINATPVTPVFAIDLVTGFVDYERLQGEQPAEIVRVSGKASIVRPAGDETETYTEEFGPALITGANSDNIILIKTTRTKDSFFRGGKVRTITTTIMQPAGVVIPDIKAYQGNTDLIISEFRKETYQYETASPITGSSGQTPCQTGNQGRLDEHIITSLKPKIAVFREIYSTYPETSNGLPQGVTDIFELVLSEREVTNYIYELGRGQIALGDFSDADIPLLEKLGSGPRISRVKKQPLGTIIPEDFAFDPNNTVSGMSILVSSEAETQTWREESYGEWSYRQSIYKSLAIAYPQVAETLRGRKTNNQITFDPIILARLVNTSDTITRSNSGQAQPPAPDTYPAAFSTQEVEVKGRANFPVDITSPFRAREKSLSFEYLSSAAYGEGAIGVVKAQADALAQIWGVVFWGRHKGAQITTDLSDSWFNYIPMCRVDVIEPEGVSANLADGFTIAIAGQRCAVNFSSILLGFTSVAQPSVIAPLYRLADIAEVAMGSAIATLERLYSLTPTAQTAAGAIGSAILTVQTIATVEPLFETSVLACGNAISGSELANLTQLSQLASGSTVNTFELFGLIESSYAAQGSAIRTTEAGIDVVLQTETSSWISRVQALGGQPTTAGTAAVDTFFVAIKASSYYSKLKLIHLFAGTTTIASAMAPLLHPSNTAATITGFTSSDYTASGTGAGIQGNSSSYIDHNFSLFANLPGSNAAIGTFSKTDGGFNAYDVGHVVNNDERFEIIMRWSDNNFYTDSFSQSGGRLSGSSPGGAGFSIASRVNNSDFRYYLNGTQIGIFTATVASMPSSVNKFLSFAADLGGSFSPTPRKLLLSFNATGMSAAEVSGFTTEVNTLAGTV